MLLPLFADDGPPVSAHFSLAHHDDQVDLILESRGGAIGKSNERNSQYSTGLFLLLERAATLGCDLLDALVASKKLLDLNLSEDARRVPLVGLTLPVTLSSIDSKSLATLLRRGQVAVASERARGGGNSTRRLLLRLRKPADVSTGDVEAVLSSGGKHAPIGRITDELLADAEDEASRDFNPDGLIDARRRILASIAQRQGQPKFRNSLIDAYAARCAISGCDLDEALEAAHIVPYLGKATNHVQNGILLRADLHTLFDRGLIGIDSDTWTVVASRRLAGTAYSELQGTSVRLPAKAGYRPSQSALRKHLLAAGLLPKPGAVLPEEATATLPPLQAEELE